MGFKLKSSIIYICIVIGLCLGLFNIAQSAFNEQINFQGKLTDNNNLAVENGNYNFQFDFYATDTAGVSLWTELCTTTEQIAVTDGLFSHLLGSVTSLDDSIFNQNLWLEVKVGGTSTSPSWETLSPRKKLGAVPAAFEAKRLEGYTTSSFAMLADDEAITGAWTFNNILAISTSSASTILSVIQSGAGNIVDFKDGATSIFTIADEGIITATGTLSVTATTTLATAGGYVGIGTTTPAYTLSVAGNIYGSGNAIFGGTVTGSNITTASSTNWNTAYGIVSASSSNWDVTYSVVNSSSSAWDAAAGQTTAYLDQAVKTTSSPTFANLTITTNATTNTLAVTGASILNSATIGTNLIIDSSGNASTTGNLTVGNVFSALSTSTFSGYVGIGTTEPIAQLDVSGKTPSSVATTAAAGLRSTSVYIQGRYAYVVNSSTTSGTFLQIFDVSNPSSPTSVATTGAGAYANSVYVQGRYAYVANSTGFQIFDVSNPSSPTSVASTTVLNNPQSVYVQGKYAYLTISPSCIFQIFDVSNPSSPTSVATTTTFGCHGSVYVQGRYAYMVSNTGYSSFQIFDVSNPSSPTSVATTTTGLISPVSVYVQGKYAYVANYNGNTLQIFNISNPSSPTSVATSTAEAGTQSVFVQGRYAYVVNYGASTLQIFDVSNPSSPTSVATTTTGSGPNSVYVQGRYAYVANYVASTLQIFDLGGAYIQQLEAGGIEAGTLSLRNNLQVNNDTDIRGGLQVGRGLDVTGASGIYASSGVPVLTVVQSGTGNIVDIKNATGTVFAINNAGVITTGTWQGTAIGTTYGGTGTSTTDWTGYPYITAGIWSTTTVTDRYGPTFIVAASDSTNTARANYQCDGTNDEAQINQALAALPAGGGTIQLLEGTYNLATSTYSDCSIKISTSTALVGLGPGTVLKIKDSFNADLNVICNSDTANGNNRILISSLKLDGNKANQSSGSQSGIYFVNVGTGTSTTAVPGADITGIWLEGFAGYGLYLQDSNNNRISNIVEGTSTWGIYLYSSSNNNISDNIFQNNSGTGVYLQQNSNNNAISDNIIQGNVSYGIVLAASCNGNAINGNIVREGTQIGIGVAGSSNNVISNNKIQNNGSDEISIQANSNANLISSNEITGASGSGYAINISDSSAINNYLTGNRYSGTGASSISDSGTGTSYGSQLFGTASLSTSTAANLILFPSGYVGMGTTTPVSTLTVYGTTTLINGNVGIGTTTPAYTLSVAGNIYGSGNAIFGGTLASATTTVTGSMTATGAVIGSNITAASSTNWNTAYGIVNSSSSAWDAAAGQATAYLDQAVKTTSSPTFANLTITANATSNTLAVTGASTLNSATIGTNLIIDSSGNASTTGNLIVGGTLKAATTTITGDLLPTTTATYNLGSASAKWANIYTATATIGSTITIGSSAITGSGNITITNSTGDIILTPASYLSLGTVATGTWQGTAVGAQYGGTGTSTVSWTGVPYITAGTWGTTTVQTGTEKYGPTIIVAASNSTNTSRADYVCDGVQDQVEIQQAINALPGEVGGTVLLLEGTFNTTSTITIATSNVSLVGSGKGTILKRSWNDTTNQNGVIAIGNGGDNAYEGAVIANLQIDGQKATHDSTKNHGIYFNYRITKSIVKNSWLQNNGGYGIYMYGGSGTENSQIFIEGNDISSNNRGLYAYYTNNSTFSGNNIQSNSGSGMSIFQTSGNNIISSNNFQSNGATEDALYMRGASSTISNNNFQSNGTAIRLDAGYGGASGNNITGNIIYEVGSGQSGISTSNNANNNIISSNRIYDSSGSQYGINVCGSNNYLIGNEISGAGFAAEIYDGGTGTTIQQRDWFEIEPSTLSVNYPGLLVGSADTAWATGTQTYIGIAATSTFSGNLVNLQKDGTSQFVIDANGNVTAGTWQGTAIGTTYGGTGTTTALASQYLWWGDGTGNLVQVASSTLAGSGGVAFLNGITGATIITGTANQITVSSSSQTITLSTPQDIGTTSSPTFANLTITANATSNTLAVTGASTLNSATIGTNLIIDSSGNASTTGAFTVGNVFSALSTSTFSGYVGVGTTSPAYTLSVVGNIYGSGNAIFGGTLSSATTTITGDLLPSVNATYNLGSDTYKWANIYTATATIGGTITLNSTDITGSGALNLTGAAASTWQTTGTNSTLTIQSASSTLISTADTLTASSTGAMILTTAGTERLRILSTGDVGIGTVNPEGKLQVAGSVLVGSGSSLEALTINRSVAADVTTQGKPSNKLTFRGSGWQTSDFSAAQTVDSTGDVGKYGSLQLDSSGYPVVAYYYVTTGDLKLMHCNDNNCSGGDESIQTVDSADDVGLNGISLQLDSSGYPVISYYDNTHFTLKLTHCNDVNCADGDESTQTIDATEYVGINSSLQLDSSGYPVVAYYSGWGLGNYALKLIHCNDANCVGGNESTSTIDTINRAGSYGISLKLDSSGYPVIAYASWEASGETNLILMHCNDVNCAGDNESTSTVEGSGWHSAPSLVLDSSGYPVISYTGNTSGAPRLKLAHCNDVNCVGGDESKQTVDSTVNAGYSYYTSLQLDSSGYPVISYYDDTNDDLRLAVCNDVNCSGGNESISTLDSGGSVGQYSSLKLDASYNAVISYYDVTNGDLKIIRDAGAPHAENIAMYLQNIVTSLSDYRLAITNSSSTELLTIDGSGYIGIGTTTPAYNLDVYGTLRAVSTSTFSGRVGIGTTTPAYTLSVVGNIYGSGNAIFGGTLNVSSISTLATTTITGGYLGVGTTTPASTLGVFGTSTFMGGNVGIGTINPTGSLEIGPDGATIKVLSQGQLIIGSNYDDDASYTNLFLGIGDTYGDIQFVEVDSNGDIVANSEMMTIKHGGNVGIGTTSPAALLDIYASSTVSVLTVTQNGTGTIANLKSGATSVFTLTSADQLKYRAGLAQTWGTLNDLVLDDFEDNDVTDWAESANGETDISATTTYIRVNDYSLAITTVIASSTNDTATTSLTVTDWSNYERLGFWIKAIYTTTSTEATTSQMISAQFASSSSATTHNITIKEMGEWQYQEWDISGVSGRTSMSWLGFRIDYDYGSPAFYIDQIRLYDSDLQASEMFVDGQGNFVVLGQKSVEIGRTSANEGSLPSIKAGSAVVELNQPLSVNTGGDVGISYDLYFANTGLSQITSEGPLTVSAGDPNHYENLTLTTGGTGDVIIDIIDSTFGFKITGWSSGGYVMKVSPAGNVDIRQNITATGNITLSQLATTSAPTFNSTSTGGSCDNATYYYLVTAANDNGETLPSATTSVATQGVSVNIVLSWVPVNGATGYYFYRSTDSAFTSGSTASSTSVTATSTTYTDDCSGDSNRTVPSDNTTGGKIMVTGDILPSTTTATSSSWSLGAPGSYWSDIYVVNEHVGDIVFSNQFVLTEAVSTSSPQALIFQNASSTPILSIDENGKLTINKLVANEIEAEKITIKDSEIAKTGITIHDRTTGEPYCVYFELGQMKTASGVCAVATGGEAVSSGGGESATTSDNLTVNFYYYDSDEDGYGNPGQFIQGTSPSAGYVSDDTDCDDHNSAINPVALEICDGVDNDCDSQIDEGDICGSSTSTKATTTEPACISNWFCVGWQLLPETIACGQTFTQTRTCTDSNNCGIEEGKPAETQESIGTDSSTCGIASCNASLNLVGECQNPCNSTGGCEICTLVCSCVDGYSDCDSDLTNGCETATSSCSTP